jgi:hypothetical protein
MLSALLAQVSNNENSEQAFDSLLYIVLEICQVKNSVISISIVFFVIFSILPVAVHYCP